MTKILSSPILSYYWRLLIGLCLLIAGPLYSALGDQTVGALALTTTTLAGMTTGAACTQTLTATGGTPPYAFSVPSGALPTGLTLSGSGVMTGTPTKVGNFAALIRVTDAKASTAQRGFSMTVAQGSSGGNPTPSPTPTPSSTPTPTPPSTPTPTPTTQYTLTVNGGFGGGTYALYATVTITASHAPAGQVFKAWTGAPVANAGSATTTVTITTNTTVTATYYTPVPVPFPVTGHPRLWITPDDLPRLQGWATASNPIYQSGLLPELSQAVNVYNTQFFPHGVAAVPYPDLGDQQGYAGLLSEQYAMLFAFHSLIDPDPSTRIQHAQRARNLLMYAFNEAAKGQLTGAPFRDPMFMLFNRANLTNEAWPLAIDWIYNATDAQGQSILTAQDKATIRTVFLRWMTECLNAYTAGGDHPAPVGVVNSTALLPGGNAWRMTSNNYYLGHARMVTLMSLVLDPADDQPLDPTLPGAVLGNTLRSYITDATGAWLYQEYAMFGDPADVRAAYNLPAGTSVGCVSGGMPPEGMLYGHSYSFILGQLLALQTAGFNDPALSGPQAAIISAPVWDRWLQGFLASLVPTAQIYPGYEYLGPIYEMTCYGDMLRLWVTPDFMQAFALRGLLDQKTGNTSRLAAEQWFAVNAVEGGAASLIKHVATPWEFQESILYFLFLDPAAAPASDPRPNYPLAYYDAPQGRLIEHTDWTPNASIFDFRCSWSSIYHQQADANQFELYRKGEWLTKGVTNYDNNIYGTTPLYHNTLTLKNTCANGIPTNLGWWEPIFWNTGSQWQLNGSSGDPTVSTSVGADYTYAFGDTTACYNRPCTLIPGNAGLDIQHASRSILWLKPDHIVVYDRATSKSAGLFKRFNLAITGTPMINGRLITSTTPAGQHLFIQSLLPTGSNVTVTATPIGSEVYPLAWLEPSKFRLTVEDTSLPSDVRFLHVLQGADAGTVTPDAATLVQSSGGTAFEGALLPGYVTLFKRDPNAAFVGTTYTVPASATVHYVTGLAANAGYSVQSQIAGPSLQVTLTPGGTYTTDSGGVLELQF